MAACSLSNNIYFSNFKPTQGWCSYYKETSLLIPRTLTGFYITEALALNVLIL